MKRFISILMMLVLLLMLCSCGPSKNEDPAPVDPPVDPGNSDVLDTALLEKFFNEVKGVWVSHYNVTDDYSFLIFSKSDGKICYTAGIPWSEFAFGGPIKKISKDGNVYSITVGVPAVPSTEEYSGHEAYDLDLTVDTTNLNSYMITANDHAKDGSVVPFTLFSSDTENYNFDALRAGSDPIQGLNEELAEKLWSQLGGIWLLDDASDEIFFTVFRKVDGQFCIEQGIPASGYSVSGSITQITEENGVYDMILYVPARPETEMDSGYDAFYAELKLKLDDMANGRISFTLYAGNGDYVRWRYASSSWDDFDWDSFYGVDIATAWNQLSGCWVSVSEGKQELFAYFYVTTSGERRVELGVPFSGGGTGGTATSFEDRTSDHTYWINIDISDPKKSMLIMVDYSAIYSKMIKMTDFFLDGTVREFVYKCEDPQHLTDDMLG